VSYVNALEIEQAKGPRVVLEEEDITLMEDGKEIQKILVSEWGRHKREINKKLNNEIYQELGVKNRLEYDHRTLGLNQEHLMKKFTEIRKQRINIKKLDKRRLTFYNKANKPIKTIPIKQEFVYKDNMTANLSEKKIANSVKKQINKNAIVSDNGKYALLIFNKVEIASIADNLEEISIGEGGKVSSEVKLMDAAGNIVWQKEFKDFSIDVNYFFVSNNGNVAILRDYTLLVYDKKGEEILTLPNNQQDAYIGSLSFMSPNGRYLIVDGVLRPRKKGTTIFIDLVDRNYWQSPERYAIPINDDDNKVNRGIIRVGYMDGARGSFIMDVTEYLKKE